jgi:hypothetical protein
MTPEQIREAASAAFNAASTAQLICTGMLTEGALVCLDAVYRAGLAAGRAEAKPKRAKKEPAAGENAVTVNAAELIRAGVDALDAECWLRTRRDKRLPLTRSAWRRVQANAEDAGITIARLVTICAEQGWAGFKLDWAVERGLIHRPPAASVSESKRAREARERVQRVAPGAAATPSRGAVEFDDAGIKRIY